MVLSKCYLVYTVPAAIRETRAGLCVVLSSTARRRRPTRYKLLKPNKIRQFDYFCIDSRVVIPHVFCYDP